MLDKPRQLFDTPFDSALAEDASSADEYAHRKPFPERQRPNEGEHFKIQ